MVVNMTDCNNEIIKAYVDKLFEENMRLCNIFERHIYNLEANYYHYKNEGSFKSKESQLLESVQNELLRQDYNRRQQEKFKTNRLRQRIRLSK